MPVNQFNDSTFPIILGAVNDGTFIRNVSQTMFTQSVDLLSIFRLAANRIFFFGAYPGPLGGPTGEIGQLATHNYVFVDPAADVMFGSGDLAGFHQTVDIHQYIGFTDRQFADCKNEFFTDTDANFTGVVISADITQTFTWNDHDGDVAFEALKRTYPISNSLGFSETLTNGAFIDVYDQFFQLSGDPQTLDTVGTDFGDDTAQTFLRQHVAFRIQGASCPEKEYTPFIGESGDATYPAVSSTAPTLGSGVLTLTHPRVSPTLTLVLKNPDFGNADVLRFTKIDRVTRGGDRKIFSDLGWGSTQSFELTINNICATTATIDQILNFLNTSLGEEIGLLDWENRQWKGIIVAPETDVTPTIGGHSVKIIFEGELV